jgi:AmmeMemoRadiSam system protein B/AmmeMemoRadiSam system protein A
VTRLVFIVLAALALVACTAAPRADQAPSYVREPAVAGAFYPAERDALARTIDGLLEGARPGAANGDAGTTLRALVCPHAGLRFSGPVAASGFRLLRNAPFTRAIVLGPAHYALLEGASVLGASAFRTPLGDVPVAAGAATLAARRPFALDVACELEAPGGSGQRERGRADLWEHSVEVEVPFLQRTLGSFELVPVVVGSIDAPAAARAIVPLLNSSTLLVVSSDLSHYHPYEEAQRLDRATVNAILDLNARSMARQEACGREPILVLLEIAKQLGWKPQLLDLRNSGDITGDRGSVVGYAAIAFFGKAPAIEPARTSAAPVTKADGALLLSWAREAVAAAVEHQPLPPADPAAVPPELREPHGVFVTLQKRGELRGCIGYLRSEAPLFEAVRETAASAALRDDRFPSVAPKELPKLEYEVSVLTTPTPLPFRSPSELLARLRPGIDGVVLHVTAGTATFLPQVWEELRDPEAFLDALCEKAGGRAGDWRQTGTRVETYQVESFR